MSHCMQYCNCRTRHFDQADITLLKYVMMVHMNGVTSLYVDTVIIIALQTLITVALHCAELQINISRDEAVWRAALRPEGSRLSQV